MNRDSLPDLLHLYHGLSGNQHALRGLLDKFNHDPGRIRTADRAELRALGASPACIGGLSSCRGAAVERDLEWASRPRNHLLAYSDERYPALLRELADYPPLLYASGDIELLQAPQIAVVGSRRCTPGGVRCAQEFAAALAAAGLAITSGMALGIDSAAHRGALDAGGKTLAVLGTGVDIVYPPRNRALARDISEQGLLLSDFALGAEARPASFPQRNRIISGLSLGTLVVEAAARSGSLITARLSAEQGREVFAVPGSIHNPQTRGCHQLIRDGATLVEKPQDITRELAVLFDFVFASRCQPAPAALPDLEPGEHALLQEIGYDPVGFDTLLQRSGLTSANLSSMLVSLELKDLIQSAPGGCFARI